MLYVSFIPIFSMVIFTNGHTQTLYLFIQTCPTKSFINIFSLFCRNKIYDNILFSRVTSHYVIDQSLISICNVKKMFGCEAKDNPQNFKNSFFLFKNNTAYRNIHIIYNYDNNSRT